MEVEGSKSPPREWFWARWGGGKGGQGNELLTVELREMIVMVISNGTGCFPQRI